MYDVALAREILRQILWSAHTISERFRPIKSAYDFTDSDRGREKLDAICMQLIAIGESVKNLDGVTGGELLPQYGEIEWKRVMGMRDVITHHYFDVDAEVVFSVCEGHIGNLARVVKQMLDDLE
jgi:uncharacterized protein with HEPN domain